jgi:GntR family transcriptional regulator
MSTTTSCEPELVLSGAGSMQEQIVAQFREQILTGRLRQGEALPTVREIAVELAINPHIVAEAYGVLSREGFLGCEEGSGTFVASAEQLRRLVADRQSRLQQLCQTFLTGAVEQGFSKGEALRAAQELAEGGSS